MSTDHPGCCYRADHLQQITLSPSDGPSCCGYAPPPPPSLLLSPPPPKRLVVVGRQPLLWCPCPPRPRASCCAFPPSSLLLWTPPSQPLVVDPPPPQPSWSPPPQPLAVPTPKNLLLYSMWTHPLALCRKLTHPPPNQPPQQEPAVCPTCNDQSITRRRHVVLLVPVLLATQSNLPVLHSQEHLQGGQSHLHPSAKQSACSRRLAVSAAGCECFPN
jgi:hypothetical protein